MSEGIIAAIYVAAEKGAGVSGHNSVAVRQARALLGIAIIPRLGKIAPTTKASRTGKSP